MRTAERPGLEKPPPACSAGILASVVLLFLAGCSSRARHDADPPRTLPQASAALERLARNPRPLRRKLLLIHGWKSTSEKFAAMIRWLRRCTTNADEMLILLDYSSREAIAELTERIFEQYESFGEVDVIGHSMGGLMARYAAQRGLLKIHALYSLSVPYKGMRPPVAILAPWDDQLRDMTRDSEFLKELNASAGDVDFSIVTYWMAGDFLVPRRSAAGEGSTHVVLSPRLKVPITPHLDITSDPRAIYDIVARLLRENGGGGKMALRGTETVDDARSALSSTEDGAAEPRPGGCVVPRAQATKAGPVGRQPEDSSKGG